MDAKLKKQYDELSDMQKMTVMITSLISGMIRSKAPFDVKRDIINAALMIYRCEIVTTLAVELIQEFDDPIEVAHAFAQFGMQCSERGQEKKRQLKNLLELMQEFGYDE